MTAEHVLQVFRPPHLLTLPLSDYFGDQKGEDLRLLRSALDPRWRLYLMGGLLRSLLLQQIRKVPLTNADVDLVVQGARSSQDSRRVLSPYRLRRDEIGGAQCQISH